MAGTLVAAGAVSTLKCLKQGERLDLALRQPVQDCRAVGEKLGLPDNSMLTMRQIDSSRVRDKRNVFVDVQEEIACRAVVTGEATRYPLAGRNRILALVVDLIADIAGISDATGHPRHRGRTQESHVLGPARNCEEIGTEH